MTLKEAREWCAARYDVLVPHYPILEQKVGKAQYVRANAKHVVKLDAEQIANIERWDGRKVATR